MNTTIFARTPKTLLGGALAALVLIPSATQANALAPTGELDLKRTYVRTGAKVQVTWNIVYPLTIDDLLRVSNSGKFQTTQDLEISIQAIGAEYKRVSHDNGHGNNDDGVDVTNPGGGSGGPNGEDDGSEPLDDEIHTNGNLKETVFELDASLWLGKNGTWEKLYDGAASGLNGGPLHHEASLPMGTSVDLAAQGNSTRGSNDVISTTNPNPNLVVLKDGDPLPSNVSAFQTGQIAGFLSPYVNDGHIELGPTQMIYLFDLDASPGTRNYNLQDLGVLVTVTPSEERTTRVGSPEISQHNRGGNPPEISQFNGVKRPSDNNLPKQNDGKNTDRPAETAAPRGNDTPSGHRNATDKLQRYGASGRDGDATPLAPAGIDIHVRVGTRVMIYHVDPEALESLNLTPEELETLLSPRPTEKQAQLINRIRILGLLTLVSDGEEGEM